MIFKPVLIEKILAGEKTVTRRPVKYSGSGRTFKDHPCRYEKGKEYAIQPGMARPTVARIRVLSVGWHYLCAIDDRDAEREGFTDRQAFVDYWTDLYGRFDDDLGVWRIGFELVEQTAQVCECCKGKGVLTLEGATV